LFVGGTVKHDGWVADENEAMRFATDLKKHYGAPQLFDPTQPATLAPPDHAPRL